MKNTNAVNKEDTVPYMLFVAEQTNKAFKEIEKNNEEAKAAFQKIEDWATGTRQRVADCFRK
jgi:hypothetical protein